MTKPYPMKDYKGISQEEMRRYLEEKRKKPRFI